MVHQDNVLFKTSIPAFLEHIKLAPVAKLALLEGQGKLGDSLAKALQMENDFMSSVDAIELHDSTSQACFDEADKWTANIIEMLRSA